MESPENSFDDYARLRDTQKLVEHTFHSDVPLLGPLISWFRQCWNNVSTTWYVRPLIDQQNRFNAATVDHLENLYAWLIEIDREQSGHVRDLAEVTLQLVQLNRQLQELTQQVIRLANPLTESSTPESRAPHRVGGAELDE